MSTSPPVLGLITTDVAPEYAPEDFDKFHATAVSYLEELWPRLTRRIDHENPDDISSAACDADSDLATLSTLLVVAKGYLRLAKRAYLIGKLGRMLTELDREIRLDAETNRVIVLRDLLEEYCKKADRRISLCQSLLGLAKRQMHIIT